MDNGSYMKQNLKKIDALDTWAVLHCQLNGKSKLRKRAGNVFGTNVNKRSITVRHNLHKLHVDFCFFIFELFFAKLFEYAAERNCIKRHFSNKPSIITNEASKQSEFFPMQDLQTLYVTKWCVLSRSGQWLVFCDRPCLLSFVAAMGNAYGQR